MTARPEVAGNPPCHCSITRFLINRCEVRAIELALKTQVSQAMLNHTMMTVNQTPDDAQWKKIASFPIGGETPAAAGVQPPTDLTFLMRLARENRWDQGFALRCLEEYRRFLYLAAVAPHDVTPLDAVVGVVDAEAVVISPNNANQRRVSLRSSPVPLLSTRSGLFLASGF